MIEEIIIDEAKDEALISCEGLVKIFKTKDIEVMALQGLDLEIRKGELMAVIGKSGSGKSTLMNIIGGLEKQTAGKIIINGKDLYSLNEREMVRYRKSTIGFVWQNSGRNLFKYLTSIENVEAPMNFTKSTNKEKRAKATRLLELVGMIHKKDAYPIQMSGGEQQRVAIAVALANSPSILLADEPTGAVDSKTSIKIQELFRELNKELGLTIIIVTHDIKLANRVDRVVMISDGKISTEKIMKDAYRDKMAILEDEDSQNTHEEYSVMDRARRVQLDEDMLAAAGIEGNKVKISIVDGKLVISGEKS